MEIDNARPSRRHDLLVVARGSAEWKALPAALRDHAAKALKNGPLAATATLGLIPQDWCICCDSISTAVAVRRRGGGIARIAQEQRCTSIALGSDLVSSEEEWELLLAGIGQGSYRWQRYSADTRSTALRVSCPVRLSSKQRQRSTVRAGQNALARDLINTPARDMGPADFEAVARSLCADSNCSMTVYRAAALRRKGCDCILSVGAAAGRDRDPRLLVITYRGRSNDHIALCGKGVCFDTGGLQIKPGAAMQLMRKDMGGAATVLAALIAHARLGGRQGVRAYIPLVENAIDGNAFRPGDILTAADGTTIEVGHTDAEGRLVLADAMCIARQAKPKALITVATLTGAALVALGRIHVPLMATDDALAEALQTAAAASGEKVWRLPLDDDHRALIRSSVATITNSGVPEAGCISAGAFLAHFAKDTPFAHFDMSPASWRDRAHELGPAGATGILVDSLCRFLER